MVKKHGTLREVLKTKLNNEDIALLKSSYDIVGGVAILEIDRKLLRKKKIIAQALLDSLKNIRSVVRKIGGHKGRFRVQKYEVLAGDKWLETLHRENNVVVRLDISKTYFTPRLSSERLRIAKQVKPDELVLVMFSGVGIYCFVIAKHSKANEIYGIEVNPSSCKDAKESLELNKLKNVRLFCGDVRKVVPKLRKKFDRIIMPLPGDSVKFLDIALKYLKKKGVVHLYFFSGEIGVDNFIEELKRKYKVNIIKLTKCGQISPRTYRWCVDFVR